MSEDVEAILRTNPFAKRSTGPFGWTQTCTADDRIRLVKGFSAEQCRQVIVLTGVQKTVRTAACQRLRKLERGKA